MPRRPSQAAFTLIELLVVVAIISVLASMLLPALSNARDSARRIACANNMKQIFTAFTFYADENDDYLPPVVTDTVSWSDYWDDTRIWRMVYPNPVSDTARKASIFACPISKSISRYSYAMNGWYPDGSSTSPLVGHRRNLATTPASTLLIGEGPNHYINGWFWIVPPGQVMYLPHGQSTRENLVYADGHLSDKTLADFPTASSDIFWKGR